MKWCGTVLISIFELLTADLEQDACFEKILVGNNS